MLNEFKNLALLDYILDKKKGISADLPGIAIISVQHLLETTATLFQSLLQLGIPSGQIMVLGKLYSTNKKAVKMIAALGITVLPNTDGNEPGKYYEMFIKDCELLWEKFEEMISLRNIHTVIVLDDGGGLISTVPSTIMEKYCVIGVEQTTSGIEKNKEGIIPIISVAGSAVKRYIEPAFISQAVIQKARKYLLNYTPGRIGVIGLGNIGLALVRDLKGGYPLTVYDIEQRDISADSEVTVADSADELFLMCDFIIGATGKDVSKEIWIDKLNSNKILVSVSSGDIEFKTLLKKSKPFLSQPVGSFLDDVVIKGRNEHSLIILRGGTPINFDNNIHSVLPENIQLTRALLLIGVIQAIEHHQQLCQQKFFTKLDPGLQKEVLKKWESSEESSKFEFAVSIERLLMEPGFIETESLGS